METETTTRANERTVDHRSVGTPSPAGALFVGAAAAFFLGGGVLTRSGSPGASTPVPWMASHVLWLAAAALATGGAAALVRRTRALETGVRGPLATGAFGLGVLHALQWSAWVYVDVVAYGHGGHDALRAALLHPFGTGHMLVHGVLVGAGAALLGWALARTAPTHRAVGLTGVAVGAATVVAALVSLATFAPVRSLPSLATIGLLAVVHAWLLVLGVALYRRGDGESDGAGLPRRGQPGGA